MPDCFYTMNWKIDKKVALLEMIGDFDDQTLMEFNIQVRDKYLQAGHSPVHLILDVTHLKNYPRNVDALRRSSEITSGANTGWLIIVGIDNVILRFLSTTVAQVVGINFRLAQSGEEALQLLRKMDTSL